MATQAQIIANHRTPFTLHPFERSPDLSGARRSPQATTSVENTLQISSFYAKQTQFPPHSNKFNSCYDKFL